MPHIDSCFLVLQNFDDLEHMFLHLFDVIWVNVGWNFENKPHQKCCSVSANERDCYAKVRIVIFKFDLLEVLRYLFIDCVGNLFYWIFTVFSGKKRSNFIASMKMVPRGTISRTAKTEYYILTKIVKISHFVHNYSCLFFLRLPDSSSKMIR